MGLLLNEHSCDLELKLLTPQKETSPLGGLEPSWQLGSTGRQNERHEGRIAGLFLPWGLFAIFCRVAPRG